MIYNVQVNKHNFRALSRTEYFNQLLHGINASQPGDRVAIATMTFAPQFPIIKQIMEAMIQAAERGVHTSLSVDAHTFMTDSAQKLPGSMWLAPSNPSRYTGIFKEKYLMLERLSKAGGHYAVTNIPKRSFSMIPAGRSHIKAAVINDTLYIGGCNLANPHHADVMVTTDDSLASDFVFQMIQTMVQTGYTSQSFMGKDTAFPLDHRSVLLRDAGTRNQSAIYEAALEMIDTAEKSIYLTCQFFPGGPTARRLLAAQKRGVEVRIVFSHPSMHGPYSLLHQAHHGQAKMRYPHSFFAGKLTRELPYLHAKIIATDKGVLVGSHNYVTAGVRFGTAEIALRSLDPELGKTLIDCVETQLAEEHAL
jgi:hypothetical protein